MDTLTPEQALHLLRTNPQVRREFQEAIQTSNDPEVVACRHLLPVVPGALDIGFNIAGLPAELAAEVLPFFVGTAATEPARSAAPTPAAPESATPPVLPFDLSTVTTEEFEGFGEAIKTDPSIRSMLQKDFLTSNEPVGVICRNMLRTNPNVLLAELLGGGYPRDIAEEYLLLLLAAASKFASPTTPYEVFQDAHNGFTIPSYTGSARNRNGIWSSTEPASEETAVDRSPQQAPRR